MTAQAKTCTLWISAGVGPPYEARRFVVLLAEQLARACADAGLELCSDTPSSDAAQSVRLLVRGDASALGGLLGTHALLMDSRRDRAGRHRGHRKRWFVRVFATGDAPTTNACFDPRDVELQFTRSGGPGGQHVNTSATAVRALHRPTGIAVRASEARSQSQNRELALERLASKLRERGAAARRVVTHEAHAQRCELVRGNPVAVWRLDARHGLRPA